MTHIKFLRVRAVKTRAVPAQHCPRTPQKLVCRNWADGHSRGPRSSTQAKQPPREAVPKSNASTAPVHAEISDFAGAGMQQTVSQIGYEGLHKLRDLRDIFRAD